MDKFQNLLVGRRSIRKFTAVPLPPDSVKQILEAALISPSSKGKQPWQFIIVENKETLKNLYECKDFGATPLLTCPLAIVVAADPSASDAWIEDASIAAIDMQLQAADCGLGSCWVQIRGRYRKDGSPSEDFVKTQLGIPDDMRILCIVAFGHKDESRKPYDLERCKWEKVHIDKW